MSGFIVFAMGLGLPRIVMPFLSILILSVGGAFSRSIIEILSSGILRVLARLYLSSDVAWGSLVMMARSMSLAGMALSSA